LVFYISTPFCLRSIRVVIDTNVFISALLFGGTPGKLIPQWKSGHIQPFVSKQIINEYVRVLAYPKFKLSETEINYILYEEILPYFEVVEIKVGKTIIQEDPADDMFIRCALSGNMNIIISGDSHLLSLKSYQKVKILTPSQFLKELED
jgi:putative PIN family toxin of toxin-antitoxin system